MPAGEHEDLTTIWLWSDAAGVFSHETALMLHQLSEALPHKVHLTLPSQWARRRLRVPKGVVVHHADVPKHERVYVGPVPVTNAFRTLSDCAADHVAREFIEAGIRQARARGMISKQDVSKIRKSERAA